jgi:ribonuclease G
MRTRVFPDDNEHIKMTQEILINVGAAEVRIAAIEDGTLQDFSSEVTLDRDGGTPQRGSRIGEIVLGRVSRVVAAIQAAFVEIGMERAGFLGVKDARSLAGPNDGEADATIAGMVREGEAILVQIVKDPIGEKGARLTTAVTIPGRAVVLTPFQPAIALSRRIVETAERDRLAALGRRLQENGDGILVDGAGYILRTNAIGATYEEVFEEATRLGEVWGEVDAARRQACPPSLLYRDLGPVERALREMAKPDVARIVIDDAAALGAAIAYCRGAMPAMAARIERFSGPGMLFEHFDIEADIEALSHPRVGLACGGWITVEVTEALSAVDVNSGSFTRAAGVEDMGLCVNLEAAKEVGRQIRLRGIGGVIVIDFIHMSDPAHTARVLEVLEHSLARDGRPVSIAPMSPFGLVEVTRKRLREPREKLVGEPCPCCRGEARVRRPGAVALDCIRRIERTARAAPGALVRVFAAPEVVAWLMDQGEVLTAALAAKGAGRVQFLAEPARLRESFDVETCPE